MRADYSKASSIVIITFVYLFAIVVGFFSYGELCDSMSETLALLVSDVIATLAVWGFGLIFENVSVYDPYWSVAPPVMFTGWAVYKHCLTLPLILLLIATWYWGIRLTGNWAKTFKGLSHEDWRYTRYRKTLSPVLFQVTNLFGLNMMPTLLVFACMVPGFRLFEMTDSANWLTWLGFAICITSATIQLVADTQSHRFRAAHPGQVCNVGLWKHGRHPNYFGEIQMWWGVWVMYASFCGIDWLVLCPIAMTALFLFISIPMMERRQLENKPGYSDYRKVTRLLICLCIFLMACSDPKQNTTDSGSIDSVSEALADGGRVNLDNLQWTREPQAFEIKDDSILITTAPHTDLWQRTYYHFRNDNAPVFQIQTKEKFFSFVVKTDFTQSHQRFDQCGIVMYLDSENWLKGSVEYENEQFQHLGSVATNNGYSDWATTAISAEVKTMWYRFSRREDDFCIECSSNGTDFSQMRICHMYAASDKISFGIYACSPEESSFTAVFSDLKITECMWKAHDGQQPD